MKLNPILAEIRQTRDDLAREAGYDLKRLFEQVREREIESARRGVKFVSFASESHEKAGEVVPEEHPKP